MPVLTDTLVNGALPAVARMDDLTHDRGLNYGDGLFETLAYIGGRLVFWQAHMSRLFEGCQRLGLPVPDEQLLHDECLSVARGSQGDCVVKLLYTRGVGGRGYRSPEQINPRRVVTRHKLPAFSMAGGLHLRWCQTPLGSSPALAGLKHCNRLEQVLARSEWSDTAIAEGLMCNQRGSVIEGTMSNLFVVSDGALMTPSLAESGVAGVIRGWIVEQAKRQGQPVREQPVGRNTVLEADEVFMTNSVMGVAPVTMLGQKRWAIGPITRYWQQTYVSALSK